MIIDHLSDHPHVISELADWYVSEWEPYYGETGRGDARADLEARLNRKTLPVGLVAIEGGQVLGTAAIDLDLTTNLTPSIVGLLVGPNHRRKGIGTALIESCIDVARELRFRRLYISTNLLGGLFERMGWEKMGKVKYLNDEHGLVYVHDL